MSNVERRISNFERGNANVITSSPHHHHHAALATDLVATDFLQEGIWWSEGENAKNFLCTDITTQIWDLEILVVKGYLLKRIILGYIGVQDFS